MSEPWAIPENWQWSHMGEVSVVVGGGTPDTRNPEYFGGDIAWLTPADLSGYTAKRISHGERNITQAGLQNSGAKKMPAGSVLFSSRAPIGYVAIAANEICTNQGFKSFILEADLNSDFIYYYLQYAKPLAIKLASGTTFLEISGKNAALIPVPIPPAAEQSRIADALDEQFSDLDAGVIALERVREKLKVYRASVLKAAVEGLLTAEWRAQHPHIEPATELLRCILIERRHRWEEEQLQKFKEKGKNPPANWKAKYKEPRRPEPPHTWVLPSTWTWTGFEDLADGTAHALKAGPFGSALKKEYYTLTGYKIYGQEQVIRGAAYFGDYFIDKARFEQLRSCAIKPGDVLISLVGTTGKVLILPEDSQPGIINPRLLKVSLSPGNVEPQFAKLVLESPYARQFFKAQSHGETMEILNLGILKQFPIPLPPLQEQRVIVEEVDDHISIIEHLETELEAKLKAAGALRQSILRSAFTGELVSQDPNDEPASELLKRVAAEREARAQAAAAAKKVGKSIGGTRPSRRTRAKSKAQGND